ncbi:MAG: thioesterase [Candidatus Delongbacteria bacterium]|jgi:medium-chain acyl-[acyl-carrier-protein] hydrolase|nr:thioesterase [Candidatus Delongbacteria bacterium]
MRYKNTRIFPFRKLDRIQASDVNKYAKLSLSGIARKFQEAAWEHAAELDYGYHNLAEKNMNWVLARILFKITHYPEWTQEIGVRSWPSDMENLFFIRDFEFRNTDARVVIAGTSSWLIVNKQGRPQIPSHVCQEIPLNADERSLFRNPSKIDIPKAQELCFNITVRRTDIDMNNHTNNVRYFDWIVDCLAQKDILEQNITSVEVNFLHESREGDALDIFYAQHDDGAHIVSGTNQNGKAVFVSKVKSR